MVGLVIGCSAPAPALAAEPDVLCTVTDPRLSEASGLAVDGSRLLMVNDDGSSLEVYVLDRSCRVTSVISAPVDPYDVEDLALAADGTLWLADIGDNSLARDTVALHALAADGRSSLFRYSYVDGLHDAEALLLDAGGRPVVVTKELSGRAGVYTASEAAPRVLSRVGSLALTPTGTPGGPAGGIGQVLVTGAALSPDGLFAVVQTYTDAYLYAVSDGDVVAALASAPVRVALPVSPQGEAIAFDSNGRDLLVTSEGTPFDVTVVPVPGSLPAPASHVGALSAGRSVGVNLAIAGLVAAALVGTYGVVRRRG